MSRLHTLPLLMTLLLLPASRRWRRAPRPPCGALPAAPLPAWEQLSEAQRESLLAPLRDRWNSADAGQRQRMLLTWPALADDEPGGARQGPPWPAPLRAHEPGTA
jgi:hypothetical protein